VPSLVVCGVVIQGWEVSDVTPLHTLPRLMHRHFERLTVPKALVSGLVLVLVLAVVVPWTVAALGPSRSADHGAVPELLVSRFPDRSGATALEGWSVVGPVAVFVMPDRSVSKVVFSFNGRIHRTERFRPFDFNDTAADGRAKLWTPPPGRHTIMAEITLPNGAWSVSATFTAVGVPVPRSTPPATTVPGTTATPPTTPRRLPAAGPRTTTPRARCDGVRLAPGAPIQAALDTGASSATFCLQPGVHRLDAPLVPRAGQRLIGTAGTVLNGARVVTGFARTAQGWAAGVPLPRDPPRRGRCESGHLGCQLSEAAFVDGRPLWRVTSLAGLRPGSFYEDYAAGVLWLADDPTGHTIEVATTKAAVSSSAPGVVVQGLVIEKFANDAQEGAVAAHGPGWVIEDNEVRLNHACGIKFSGAQVLGNSAHHNGQLGLCGGGRRSLVSGNDIAFNNLAQFDVGWEAGGAKFCRTSQLTIRRNRVHDNAGPGLWTDCDSTTTVYQDNVIMNNDGPGILHEISCDAVIRGNTIAGNGFKDPTGWVDGAGILISSSPDAEIDHNIVDRNYNGISLRQDDRGGGIHCSRVVERVDVHDNQVTMGRGSTGLSLTSGDTSWFTTRGNRFHGNHYTLIGGRERFAWMGQTCDPNRWRAFGQDLDGTFRYG
jgi:nitrous oxidase accessory protein NosD